MGLIIFSSLAYLSAQRFIFSSNKISGLSFWSSSLMIFWAMSSTFTEVRIWVPSDAKLTPADTSTCFLPLSLVLIWNNWFNPFTEAIFDLSASMRKAVTLQFGNAFCVTYFWNATSCKYGFQPLSTKPVLFTKLREPLPSNDLAFTSIRFIWFPIFTSTSTRIKRFPYKIAASYTMTFSCCNNSCVRFSGAS